MTASAPTPLLAGNYTFESIYGALRAQARQYLRSEQNGYSLSPSELVHEAWISLARSQKLNVNDSSHYVRLVSRVMKNLLIDHARRRKAATHGGSVQWVEWNDAAAAPEDDGDAARVVAAALDDLAVRSPRLAALVKLRYFSGFTEAEVAQILGISSRSVRRQWRVARLQLMEILH